MRTMKMNFKTTALLIMFMMTFLSCNKENLFVEPVAVDVTKDEDTNGGGDTQADPTLPCNFNLNNVQANSTIVINCVLDLEGQTITLPSSVTIAYEGGDIINGTINFSDNGVIDGNLLNSTLTIGGASPQVKDPTFEFKPERWGIVEGETTSDIALNNNIILESTMFLVKELGVTTFKIDKLDAYFEVSKVTSTTTNQNFYPQKEAVNIPSDFNLVMTDNTILRVFPTVGKVAASLMGIDDVSNVTVRGGILYGDRDLRQYSGPNVEDGSHLLTIRSGKNIILDGVKFTMGSIGGVNINSYGFSFNPDYNPTNNVTIKNCIFDKIRMIALPITDGRNILVENNEFIDTANPTQNSDGGVVGYAIDIEPVRERNAAGELVYYQRVQDVIIRGNKERGSRVGAFTIYVGDNIIIENNDLERLVSWSYAKNSKVRNNYFNAGGSNTSGTAILAAGFGDTVYNNEVSGNLINGYSTGVTVYNGKLKIFENEITNTSRAIVMDNVDDMEIYDNKIISNKANSSGIYFQITRANNIRVRNNEVNVLTNHVRVVDLNQSAEDQNNNVVIENNQFVSSAVTQISRGTGLTLNNNLFNGRIQISSSNKLIFDNNIINSPDGHGISISGVSSDINLSNNNITKPTNFQCIYDPNKSQNLITSNNLCN